MLDIVTSIHAPSPPRRLQRLRRMAALRDLVAEVGFKQSQLIQPLFLCESFATDEPIAGIPNNLRHTARSIAERFERDLAAGVRQFLLFPIPARKTGSHFSADFVSETVRALRAREGLLDFDAALLESWYVLRRAGAAFIITYGAREAHRLGLAAR
jgi:delta-aminolevulinic acid dehydratase/porphobilinogen synthase